MTTVDSKVLSFLFDSLKADPAPVDTLPEISSTEMILGIEAESTLRLITAHKKLTKNSDPDEDLITRDLKSRLLETARLLERRMQLGEEAKGIESFKLRQGGKIVAGKRK